MPIVSTIGDGNMNIQIEGAKELQALFKKAPEKVRSEVNKAIGSAILVLTRLSRLNFYYFPNPKTKNTPRTGSLMGRYMQYSLGDMQGRLDNKAPYGIYVHEGTYKMQPARPFFRQAVEQSKLETTRFFQTALNNIIKSLTI